ncbi:hypothetical protein EUGRSUZ_H03785 [Eucalyptus grandis]|uniref:TIR domain-containing protein n=3 Tax=Eucalyptus grandis TaxID=71139 RepID=A0A059B563_EUCGR|nr:hypothetical protein EUGRSUZ_H03785 [Eucalyptus grandis]KAK3417814.1 hypothetical protein EUGRSUZ_H03785 [Eucalyptus grandis]
MCCTDFAAILFNLVFKRRSEEINGEEANDDAAANDETTRGSSSTHTSTEGHEMATPSGYDYEVFLSFRGPDTRVGFTDFLYTSMIDMGIRAYKDDEDLRKGEEFGPTLLQAIEQSRISIPILSKGYASSVWCLKELVKMVECRKTKGQKIMPIFYDVAPAEVRYQTRSYKEAFDSHKNKNRHDEGTMCEWKAALKEVSSLDGWNLLDMQNRREGEFARKFTQEVFNELKRAYLVLSNYLVNVDNHVDAIMEMIGVGTSETRIIGIHGMGGIGKSTIAKLIYNKLLRDFRNCCFLRDIRETSTRNGIQCLQNQLIGDILKTKSIYIKDIDEGTQTIKDRLSNKRVLLLLDDVEKYDQIDALVGKRDWLGRGSKIIITARNKDILEVPEVDCSYELSGMDPDQSLQLFSKHAFRKDYPLDEYIGQSKRAIGIARGLPLTLEVIGSLLCCTKKENWDLMLKKLESVPHKTIQSKLKISYDALDVRQQHIFLDIACIFIGCDKAIVVRFWDESKFPEEAIEVLQNMSLIKIEGYNKVWMHDQLRDLGREIVHRESNMKIEKQSRVWDYKEGLDLLRRHKGQKEVEALRLKSDHERRYHFTYEDFKSLSNLRFLEVDDSKGNFGAEETLLWRWHELPSNVLPTNVFQENLDLLPQLRWLSWHNISPMLNITNFSMEDLVILDLSKSRIKHDWKGWSYMKMAKNLKVLNLSNCQRLKRTPIFSAHPNLERLILRDCESLTEIDRSIGKLERLVFLELSYCRNLQRLPNELGDLARLEYLSLDICNSLKSLPDTIGNLESLIELNLSGTTIKELPDFIGKLKNLKVVRMWNGEISKIPDAFWTIEKLEDISGHCGNARVKIGDCIHRNQSLRELHLVDVVILALPRLPESLIYLDLTYLCMDAFPDLSNLTNLQRLKLGFSPVCTDGPPVDNLMPRWLGNLTKLRYLTLRFGGPTASTIDEPSLPPQLESLRLCWSDLCRLPRLPSSLSSLMLWSCCSLSLIEDLSNLNELSFLGIMGTAITEIQGLGCLENLQSLLLSGPRQVKILPDLSNLNKLSHLELYDCDKLVEIQGELPKYLNELSIRSCGSLEKLPDLSGLKELQTIKVRNCTKLIVEAIFSFARRSQADLLENLRYLDIGDLEQVEILPDLSSLSKLRNLEVDSCRNLAEIQGELPLSLKRLKIFACESLQKLPDLSSLKNLKQVYIRRCTTLKGKAILGSAQRSQANLWENLLYLGICDLGQVKILPDLSASNKLRCLRVSNCGKLVEIQSELPQSLEKLEISSCESLQKLPDLSSLKVEEVEISSCGSLKNLDDLSFSFGPQIVVIVGCQKLNVEGILGSARKSQANLSENLRYLQICGFGQVKALPDLRNLNKLRCLQVEKCPSLVEIQGELPQSLEELEISSCGSLQRLPDLSSLKGLEKVVMKGCMQLNVEAIYRLCLERSVEFVG